MISWCGTFTWNRSVAVADGVMVREFGLESLDIKLTWNHLHCWMESWCVFFSWDRPVDNLIRSWCGNFESNRGVELLPGSTHCVAIAGGEMKLD